ncbi:MAG: ATP-binding protein, partial [Gemmatimonadota bacterium]|nr:ATP-binding protein [Gemmatimonadota bacterium]
DVGMRVEFMGRVFTISAAREQILGLLISTVEDAVRQNHELRRREEELRAAQAELARYAGALEARLDNVLNSIPDVVFSLSADMATAHYVSPAVERVLGCAPVDFALAWLVGRAHADDRAALDMLTTHLQAMRTPQRLEFRLVAPDGQTRWIAATLVPVVEGGAVARVDGVARDITDRVETERRLQEAEQQVRQAQKMEAIGLLAGAVAHDFNNLLMVVHGEADLALTGELPESVRESFTDIRAAAERATALTKQLLTFSRRDVVAPQVLDPNAIVDGMRKLLPRLLGERVQTSVTLDPDAGTVLMDPVQLEQAVMNLAVNARDAMPEGGELRIATERIRLAAGKVLAQVKLEPGEYVRLSVRDTGVGMTPAVAERVCEPFFTTKPAGQGTGLGLATTFGIVKDAGGAIDIESAPGKGTTVSLYLPRAAAVRARPRRNALNGQPSGGSETILVVEDDAEVRRIAERILARLGYRSHSVATGEEALDVLGRGAEVVDLLITDVVLPGMSGPELAASAQRLRPGLKTVFMSGYSRETHSVGAIEAAPRLQKPFTPQAMARAVREALDAPTGGALGAAS